nr:astacin-like metalloendopeptidase [Pogona vitticeps]
MDVSLGIWPVLIGFLWLFSALPVHGRGDTFEAEHLEGQEGRNPSDDILDINQALILPEAPESSFLMEGDIIKASPFRLFFSANPRWPKKRGIVQIPYVISYRYDKSTVKIIQEAFEDFARFTCIKFVPYSYQRDFISIAPLSGCFSSIGRVGGMQVVSLAPACLQRGKGVALHELMHVLGFWHEHSRADRDKYISISWNEILTGFEMNFMKSWNTNMLVDYDYSSVMHYGRNAFSMTGLPTIIPLSGSSTPLGQRWNLSQSDIARVNKLYKCSQVAAQPEASTERVIRENMMDFIPSEPPPCSALSKVDTSAAQTFSAVASATEMAPATQETLGTPGPSSSKAVGGGTSVPEDHMKITWLPGKENQMQTKGSPETSGEEKVRGEFPAVTEKMPHDETQSREMEIPTTVGALKKTSVTPPSPTSRPRELGRQPPSYRGASFTNEPSLHEARKGTAAKMEFLPSFLTKGPALFSADVVQGPTRRPGRKETEEEFSRPTRAMPRKHGTELPTALEMGSSLATGSREPEVESGSPNPTEGYSFSMLEEDHEERPRKMDRQTIGISGNETDHPTHTSPVGSSSYKTFALRVSRNLATSSRAVELEEETLGFANVPTQTRMGEEAVESSDGRQVSMLPSVWSSGGRKQGARTKLEHDEPPGKESLARVKAPGNHLDWATGGTPSVPWAVVTGRVAASRQKEATVSRGNSAGYSLEEEPFSLAPAHRARKGYRRVTFAKHTTMGSVFVKAEGWTPGDHVDLPSQVSTLEEWTSPVTKSNQATRPMEGTRLPRPPSPKTAGLRSTVSWPQSSNREGSSPTAFSVGWDPPQGAQGGEIEHVMEAASTARREKPTAGQRTHGSREGELGTEPSEEAKTHGKQSLQGLLSTEPLRSPGPTEPGQWTAGNQRQPSPPLFTGEGQDRIQSRSPSGLRTTVPLRQCGSFSGTKAPLREGTAKRKVSLHAQLKPGATNGERRRQGTKEQSFALEGKPLPVTEAGTSLSWVNGSHNLRGRERTGHYAGVLKEETSSARRIELTQTPSEKRPQGNPSGQAPAESTSTGPSHFSIVSVLRKPALKPPSGSLSFLGTEPVMNSESPAPQSLQRGPEKRVASTASVAIPPAARRPSEPGSVREETASLQGRHWVTRPSQDVIPGRSGAESTLQPKTLAHIPTEDTDLFLTPGSLELPQLPKVSEGSSGSHERTEFLPSAGTFVTVGTSVAPYLTRAISPDFGAGQSNAPVGSKEATNTISRERGDTAMETGASIPLLVERHGTLSAGGSVLGSHEEHVAMSTPPTHQRELQTAVGSLEESIQETTGSNSTKLISGEKGENLTLKSGIYKSEISTAAIYTRIEVKDSRQTGFGTLNMGGWDSPQSTYFNSTEDTGKFITVHEEKWSTQNTVGPTSKLHSGASMIPGSKTQLREVTTSVPGVQKPLGTDKVDRTFPLEVNAEDVYLRDTAPMAEATVALGISRGHHQTSGSVGNGFWSKYIMPHATEGPEEMQDPSRFPLMNRTYVGRSIGEIIPSSKEPSKQIPEAQVVDKVEEATRNPWTRMKPMSNRDSSVDKSGSLHHVAKRSLLEMVGFPEHLSPRKLKLTKESSMEQVLKRTWTASAGGLTHLMPVPGTFKVHVGHPLVGHKDGSFSSEKVAKAMEPAEATRVSKTLGLLWRLPSNLTKVGNDPVIHERTAKATQPLFCSFEKDLCSWKQSTKDDLDWVLEKEEELPAVPVEDGSTSGTPCRTSGGHISLKPSGLAPMQKAILISPVMSGVGCLRFWYNTTDAHTGEINFYIKLLNSSEWHKAWSTKGGQGPSWHQITVPITETSELQGALEGVVATSPLGIDDLLVCWKPCWQCHDTVPRVLCTKQTE